MVKLRANYYCRGITLREALQCPVNRQPGFRARDSYSRRLPLVLRVIQMQESQDGSLTRSDGTSCFSKSNTPAVGVGRQRDHRTIMTIEVGNLFLCAFFFVIERIL